jgi:hypothetical protein
MKYLYVFLIIFVASLSFSCDAGDGRLNFLIFNTVELPSTPEKMEAITNLFEKSSGFDTRVGVSHIFSYFRKDIQEVKKDLQAFLDSAEKTNTPVVIKFDGEQWWDNRPDLWNWWDKDKPGYDPVNVKNVEWTGWESERAVKIA